MRLINIIKSAFTGKTYNDKQPQLVMPTKPVYHPHPVKPVRDKVRPVPDEVWKNVKGAIAPIGGTHIDYLRSMKIPEHMNGDNVKMKINPEVEKKAKEATDRFLHKFRK